MTKLSVTMRKIKDAIYEILCLLLAIVFVYPVFYMVQASFKTHKEFGNPLSFPSILYLGNYMQVFKQVDVFQVYFNTLILCVGTLSLTIFLASMTGYTLARMKHIFFRICFFIFIAGMIIPFQSNLVLLFKMALFMHLYDTRTFLILLYTAGGIPLAVFLYMGFTKSIPREIEESAWIDGCGRFRMFWVIVFPLLLPATGTYIIMTVYGIWNDFMGPLIFLQDVNKMTLMTKIFQYKLEKNVDYGPIFSLSVLATLPLLVLFLFTQKYFIKGLTGGALKG
ncbi:carbohydrate ABC transporter permease [Paenibacillus psychroresistens]|uniref:Carbohydrate ABC transporter permease n=1 Tax=Paenibacillus psychroresistens TaxID=1778678 RepID=A0A6B8RG34_9BACL|nr:carbohydrate ABC transporter permease [Paenibacillus psychroresistens]QGQ94326.1 carbohydrate ABC transporter permease [Paenibacillus psychroresistens]